MHSVCICVETVYSTNGVPQDSEVDCGDISRVFLMGERVK